MCGGSGLHCVVLCWPGGMAVVKRWLPGAVAVVDSFHSMTLLAGVTTAWVCWRGEEDWCLSSFIIDSIVAFRHAPYLVGWFDEMKDKEVMCTVGSGGVHCECKSSCGNV